MKDNQEKKSILFYRDWFEMLQEMDADERLAAYEAVFKYAFDGIEPTDKLIRVATKLVFAAIDRDKEKYDEIKRKRSEYGKRHKGNQYTKKTEEENGAKVPLVPKNGTNGTVNDNVNDNVNVLQDTNVSMCNKENTLKCVCIKESETSSPHTHTEGVSEKKKGEDNYQQFLAMLERGYPTVAQLTPPSYDALVILFKECGKDWKNVWDITAQMENDPNLLKRNKYYTTAFRKYKRAQR